MRIEGTLTTWNDKREFGYISPAQGGPEVFVHVSAFPLDMHRPAVGERLSFEIETGKDRRLRAKNLRCPPRRAIAADAHVIAPPKHEIKRIFGLAFSLVALLGLAAFGFSESARRSAPPTQQASAKASPLTPSASPLRASAGPLAQR